MSVHVYMFLLVVCLLLSLALLWRLDWFPLRPASSRGGVKRTRLQRLLKPRCPDDCPACRLASTASSGRGPAPAPVRPWREGKSRRGAPKRIDTQGFACPNRDCPTLETPRHTFMRWWAMASMARLSGFRPFGVRRAAPPSVLDETRLSPV